MKRVSNLGRIALAAAATLSATVSAQTAPDTLRQAAGDHLLIGTALMSQQLDDAGMAELVARQFNAITPENETKPDTLQPKPGQFNFGPADKIVAFAQAHDMKVIGHTLVWHNQTPKWMTTGDDGEPLPREKALENLKTHIDTVVKHFKGKVVGWDVVNEALPDSEGDLRDTPWRKAIGDDYIEKAFEFAHAADPDAELYYNDYNIEQAYKHPRAVKLIRSLKEKGVPITGVGIQGHFLIGSPSAQEIDQAITDFAALGVKVMFTEVDVDPLPRKAAGAEINSREAGTDPYKDGLPDDVQKKLADRYAEIFGIFKKHEADITRVTIWGIHDGVSWLNNYPVRGRTNYALLFDRNLKPKPAAEAVIKVLSAP